jgi:predicted small lipoprotein YifL
MKRLIAFIAVGLASCGSLEPLTLPSPDLKAPAGRISSKPDIAPTKVIPKAKAITYKGIAPSVVVVAEDEKLGMKLERSMFHELNRLGLIAKEGNWKVVGVIENGKVFWRVVDERGSSIIDFQQSGVTEASVLAIVPALAVHLPKGP